MLGEVLWTQQKCSMYKGVSQTSVNFRFIGIVEKVPEVGNSTMSWHGMRQILQSMYGSDVVVSLECKGYSFLFL